jgi:hypothetical protein
VGSVPSFFMRPSSGRRLSLFLIPVPFVVATA